MNRKTDTILVRPDEALDEEKLIEYLKDKLDGSDNFLILRQFPGGKANLTYHLDFGSHEYVLRRPPLGPIPPGAHDMGREYSVLSVLHNEYQMAPKAYLFEQNKDIIGAPFFIMERKKGIVVRTEMPGDYKKNSNAGIEMSIALIKSLAELHRVNVKKIGLKNLGKPDGFIERQVHGWYKRWVMSKHKDIDDVETIYHWLATNIPKTNFYSLIHNDYKLDNAMFSFNDPTKMIAVFDWDMCTLGDPLCDLGSLLSYWKNPDDPSFFRDLSMMPKDGIFLKRDELIKIYAQYSGFDVKNIVFYHVLGLFKLIGIIAQIYVRYIRGQTKDKRFANFGDAIPFIARFAINVSKT